LAKKASYSTIDGRVRRSYIKIKEVKGYEDKKCLNAGSSSLSVG
jgi:hypothetical protein